MATKNVWLNYDRTALDAQYDNQRTVADYGAVMGEWAQASARAREMSVVTSDLPYDDHPRARIDYYPAGARSPLVIFFHGGFWRSFDKTGLAFLAPAFVSAGISVAFPNYPLAPEAGMQSIVRHARRAVEWLLERAGDLGFDRSRVWVAGHSAGAHLAVTATANLPEALRVSGCCAISGIYDLRPIQLSYLDYTLHLSDADVPACSPMTFEPRWPPLITAVGGGETEEFRRQTEAFVAHAQRGGSVRHSFRPGIDHYEAVRSLARPDDPLFRQIVTAVRQ
jgi:arylformamidase